MDKNSDVAKEQQPRDLRRRANLSVGGALPLILLCNCAELSLTSVITPSSVTLLIVGPCEGVDTGVNTEHFTALTFETSGVSEHVWDSDPDSSASRAHPDLASEGTGQGTLITAAFHNSNAELISVAAFYHGGGTIFQLMSGRITKCLRRTGRYRAHAFIATWNEILEHDISNQARYFHLQSGTDAITGIRMERCAAQCFLCEQKGQQEDGVKAVHTDQVFVFLQAYRFLAVNKKLGLSGRPDRPVGCIGTCKIYRILGKTVVCYPIVFDLSDFYLSQDVMLLIDDIKNTLQFIKQCWKMQGRPLFLVLIREDNIKGSRFNPVLDMLASFKKGVIGGVKVHVDRLQTLISGAFVEQLDFLRVNEAEIPEFKSFEELELPKHSKVKRQTSTPNASDLEQQPEISVEEWQNKPTYEILQKFHDCNCLASQAQLACILLRREGPDFLAKDENLMEELERIYRRAGSRKLWLAVRHAAAITKKYASSIAPHITTILVHGKQVKSVVRLAASLLTKLVDSLAPSITSILVQGKQVTLGLFGHEEEVISNPLSPGVIQGIIYSKCSPQGGEREAVLQQELVIHIGWIISNNPELFSGMLKIRVGWIVQAMKHELKIRAGDLAPQDIYQLSPSDIKQLLLDVLQPQHTARSWLNRRQIDGSLNRTPLGFYDRVWQILERTPNGIVVGGTHLPQQPTLSDMTMYEMNFSLLVEDTLKNIVLPEYRQIIVELLMVVAIVLERNPELEFGDKVDLDSLVKEAFNDFQRDRSRFEGMEKQDDMEVFYNTPPLGKRGTSSYLTKAVMIQLLQGDMKPCKDDPCAVS
ncbi:hypothetical protein CCH79_00004797 [Gambusia affinis]|uniref:Phosphorylase b kinase regulatory subunit n=1 Tax=Gambusia affinis TaxID=33528 RepID=A0A315V7B0_GAMAF|nr:hypothetical protein CCH79_00004797 [Gambusia affinis]